MAASSLTLEDPPACPGTADCWSTHTALTHTQTHKQIHTLNTHQNTQTQINHTINQIQTSKHKQKSKHNTDTNIKLKTQNYPET